MKQSLLEQLCWAARRYTKEQQLLCDIILDNGKQEGPKKEFKSTLIEEIHTDIHSARGHERKTSTADTHSARGRERKSSTADTHSARGRERKTSTADTHSARGRERKSSTADRPTQEDRQTYSSDAPLCKSFLKIPCLLFLVSMYKQGIKIISLDYDYT